MKPPCVPILSLEPDELLPPTASAHQRRLLQSALQLLSHIKIDLPQLKSPRTCPIEFLPWLAWEASVEHWCATWGESVKRQVIENALARHKRRGTRAAMLQALADFELNQSSVIEWFENGQHPLTFQIQFPLNCNPKLVNADNVKDLKALIDNNKPIRSHYTLVVQLELELHLKADLQVRIDKFVSLHWSL